MGYVSVHSSGGNDEDYVYSYLSGRVGNGETGVLFHFWTTEMFYNASVATNWKGTMQSLEQEPHREHSKGVRTTSDISPMPKTHSVTDPFTIRLSLHPGEKNGVNEPLTPAGMSSSYRLQNRPMLRDFLHCAFGCGLCTSVPQKKPCCLSAGSRCTVAGSRISGFACILMPRLPS